ncbi:MAG: nitronate monooxygenase [Vallitaleaceae bacterium]|jgi:nitronate monooxygenase|nr:nitronate monooxygenase [Vallitaleaceae bacterium]
MDIKMLKIGNLNIPIPIIQGGMGIGVSKSRLAAAVANEGGIGVISGAQIGYLEADFATNPLEANKRALRREIIKAKHDAPGGIIGVNLMVAMKNYADFVKVAVEEKIDLIISGAGLPIELPGLVKGSKVKIVPIVSSLRAAKLILRSWKRDYDVEPDAIIVEGSEAGGHLGFKFDELYNHTTQKLKDIVIELKEYLTSLNIKIPIIAAGGLLTASDISNIMDAGASGVQLGTRFVVTEECDASTPFKEAYINAKKENIQIMMSPVGLPGRALNNPFLKQVERLKRIKVDKCYFCLHKCNPAETVFCITTALINAVEGRLDEGLIFVGAGAYFVDRISTVKEVMDELKLGFYSALNIDKPMSTI